MKMKQRTRLMHTGDDLLGPAMNNKKNEDSEIPLHQVKPTEHFIEAQVQEGDTLQAIALRFYCSISELKRINRIHKDNEIFARRIVKVPVTPYSVLTELIPTSQQEPLPSTSTQLPSDHLDNNTYSNLHSGLPNNLSINSDIKSDFSIDCNAVVMNSTLVPSVVPYTDNESKEIISEDTSLLPSKNKEKISVETVVVKDLTSHGADLGCKWYHLVCFMLVLGVVVPLVYVMFYLDKHEHTDVPPLYQPS